MTVPLVQPGPCNFITDVDGICVGNAGDSTLRSGATVVLPEPRCVGSVDVRGGAPGTRDTDALLGGVPIWAATMPPSRLRRVCGTFVRRLPWLVLTIAAAT